MFFIFSRSYGWTDQYINILFIHQSHAIWPPREKFHLTIFIVASGSPQMFYGMPNSISHSRWALSRRPASISPAALACSQINFYTRAPSPKYTDARFILRSPEMVSPLPLTFFLIHRAIPFYYSRYVHRCGGREGKNERKKGKMEGREKGRTKKEGKKERKKDAGVKGNGCVWKARIWKIKARDKYSSM